MVMFPARFGRRIFPASVHHNEPERNDFETSSQDWQKRYRTDDVPGDCTDGVQGHRDVSAYDQHRQRHNHQARDPKDPPSLYPAGAAKLQAPTTFACSLVPGKGVHAGDKPASSATSKRRLTPDSPSYKTLITYMHTHRITIQQHKHTVSILLVLRYKVLTSE